MPQAHGPEDLRLPTGVHPLEIPVLLAERSRRESLWGQRLIFCLSLRGGRTLGCPHLVDPPQPAKSPDGEHVTVRPACRSYWRQEPLAAGCKQYVLLAQRPTRAGNLCSAYSGGALADLGRWGGVSTCLGSLQLLLSQGGMRSLLRVEGQGKLLVGEGQAR